MTHYTYEIINIINGKRYIGSRTCSGNPEDDLGIKYFSSSKDKDFIKEQKEHPWRFRYKITGIYPTRKSAIQEEINLHEFFDVGINPEFYNKAKQTSIGFDRSGCKHNKASRIKMSISHIGIQSGENNPMYGRTHTVDSRKKISEKVSGDKNGNSNGLTESHKKKLCESWTEERKIYISEKYKGKGNPMYGIKQEQVTCPYCNKVGGKPTMTRWHFENCKYKTKN